MQKWFYMLKTLRNVVSHNWIIIPFNGNLERYIDVNKVISYYGVNITKDEVLAFANTL